MATPMAARKDARKPDDAAAQKRARRRRPAAPARPRAAGGDAKLWAQQDLNDELQSRNEELETVNEELQSLNDEMSAMEEQMRGLGEDSRRTNDFLRLLLDTSPDALIACDANNRVAFWNKAAIKRFRLSPQQAVGSELFELVPALDIPALRAASKKVRLAGRAGRVTLKQEGVEYLFDSLPSGAGNRRSYLLRVRPVSG
jgi:two-component system CheB/CheR fusion protein